MSLLPLSPSLPAHTFPSLSPSVRPSVRPQVDNSLCWEPGLPTHPQKPATPTLVCSAPTTGLFPHVMSSVPRDVEGAYFISDWQSSVLGCWVPTPLHSSAGPRDQPPAPAPPAWQGAGGPLGRLGPRGGGEEEAGRAAVQPPPAGRAAFLGGRRSDVDPGAASAAGGARPGGFLNPPPRPGRHFPSSTAPPLEGERARGSAAKEPRVPPSPASPGARGVESRAAPTREPRGAPTAPDSAPIPAAARPAPRRQRSPPAPPA